MRVYECRTAAPTGPQDCYGSSVYKYDGQTDPTQVLPDGPSNALDAPTDPSVDAFVHSIEPDLVVVSPLILARSDLGDYLATARARGIPAVFAVASWDNLSSKGLVTQVPEWVTLWNEIQKREAVADHRVPSERIVVTGAQLFDQWFDRGPSTGRDEFLRRIGLSGDYVLYVGSSPNIAEPSREIAFVRRWLEDDRPFSALVRPHPYALEASADVDLGEEAAVAPEGALERMIPNYLLRKDGLP